MKSKSIVRVLAAIGIFASSVTVAQAGGGAGTAVPINAFYQCQSIDGGNLGEVVNTHLPGSTEPINTNLKVGNAILECFQVDVAFTAGGGPINGSISSSQMKCYAVTAKGPKAASTQVVLTDDFGPETLNVSPAVQMICGPALTSSGE